MKHRMQIAATLALAGATLSAQAAILSYSDRASWIGAGVTVTGSENFNSVVADDQFGGGGSRTFGDLTLTGQTNLASESVLDVASFLGPNGFDGTPLLNARSLDNGESIDLVFATPISALGFEWENYDVDGDDFFIQIDGATVFTNVSNVGEKGFLGLVSGSGTFDTVKIFGTAAIGTFNAFDNLEWGTAAAVPEPELAWLPLATGLLGLVAWRRRRATGRDRISA